jgi:hypothetical protein
MVDIRRRSLATSVGAQTTLAAADDLNGAGITLNVTGAMGVIIAQINNGTAGTAGVDVIEESHDGGENWEDCDTLLALSADPFTGTLVANAELNAAGVEPTGAALFKAGPFEGPTLIRCGRGGSGEQGTAWVTGAPSVVAAIIK